MDVFKLTRELIDIPSPTGAERDVGYFLADYLQNLNYHVERQEVSPERANVIATHAASSHPRVVLSTHMDTVPPYLPSREDEAQIYGRGACDAKGIIAAQIAAAERLRAEGCEDFGLLFTVDEEMSSEGARVANTHPLAATCQYLINGEPTDNRLASGSKGSLRVALKTAGRAAHSAYPEQGDSAIEKLLDVLADIRACAWPKDKFFGATTCNIGVIDGGTRPNVIPDEAQAVLQIRLVTPSSHIKNLLEQIVAGRAHIEYLSVAEPLRLHTIEGFDACVVRFTTDIPYLSNWSTPLLLGPGSVLVAHTAQERIAKRELAQAVDLYARLTRSLLARANDASLVIAAEGSAE